MVLYAEFLLNIQNQRLDNSKHWWQFLGSFILNYRLTEDLEKRCLYYFIINEKRKMRKKSQAWF